MQQRHTINAHQHARLHTLTGHMHVLCCWLMLLPLPRGVCVQADVRTLERVGERIKDGIRDIDSRVSRISQTATRIGDRLQVS